LSHGSELLVRLVYHDGLLIVGAEYSLDTGVFTCLDGARSSSAVQPCQWISAMKPPSRGLLSS